MYGILKDARQWPVVLNLILELGQGSNDVLALLLGEFVAMAANAAVHIIDCAGEAALVRRRVGRYRGQFCGQSQSSKPPTNLWVQMPNDPVDLLDTPNGASLCTTPFFRASSAAMSLDSLINRSEPTWWSLLRKDPHKTLAQSLYRSRGQNIPAGSSGLKVVCISDTHNTKPNVPPGDLLIHAGDFTQSGTLKELQAQIDWLTSLPHQHKVAIAGNHDLVLDSTTQAAAEGRHLINWGSVIYLENESTVCHFAGGRKLTIHGNPLTRRHGNWCFQYSSTADVFSSTVPEDTDVLITHSPPSFHLDLGGLGDWNLLREVWRVRPMLHVFGHIHAAHGTENAIFDSFQVRYESLYHRSEGFVSLVQMVLLLLFQKLFGSRPSRTITTFVNAASVGGLKDNLVREPIVVYI
ncbi:hypothetical protein FH972_023567 [Carpinus fangiana]|uniref:Calcineurin-like phosphoesterase domain-containing protein n=1 Tax=Carpinus fangiana TaxID=176857 RepID=A0A5N6KVJ1_9ROSI|nr:hypothetical protein FH972_023567 [Carpinus fangiana]